MVSLDLKVYNGFPAIIEHRLTVILPQMTQNTERTPKREIAIHLFKLK